MKNEVHLCFGCAFAFRLYLAIRNGQCISKGVDVHRPNVCRFLIVFALIIFLVWRVILPQRELVANIYVFCAIFFGLLIASFFSSAMEAALTSASKHEDLLLEVKREKSEIVKSRDTLLQQISADNSEVLSRSSQQQLAKLMKQARSLELKEYVISEEGRGVAVGSFASLSVLLNVALTAFLPLAMLTTTLTGKVGISYLGLVPGDAGAYIFDWKYWDLTSGKIFVFVLVSLPLLMFGKIVPKEIGSRKYKFFAMNLNWVARQTVRLLGWLPAGSLWLFVKR